MQRIERYGVIALVLLLVTIAVVSFWDDGTSTEAAERGGDERQERLAQNAAKTDARVKAPRRKPAQRDAQLPTTGPKRASSPGGRAVQPAVAQGNEPRTKPKPKSKSKSKPGNGFNTVPPTVASRLVEGPRGSEVALEREEDDVEFPVLDPDPRKSGGRGAHGNGNSSRGGQPTAADIARGIESPRPPVDPAPSVVPGTQPRPRAATYTVKGGDSLSGIASRELGTKDRLDELLALNGISNPDLIFEGQVLKLPTGAAPASSLRTVVSKESKEIPPAGPARGVYVVQAGEVLGVIAQRELGSAKRYPEIVALNPGLDPDRILEGMRLRMPAEWRAGSVVASASQPREPRPARRSSTPSTRANKVR